MHQPTLLFLPTYNENAGVSTLVPRLLEKVPSLDILIVDDGSTDGTAQTSASLAQREARVTMLQRGSKQGLGSANVTAMQYAIGHGYRFLASMDADCSHDPDELPRLLDRMEQEPACDVVIGSRYVRGGRICNWSLGRRVTSYLVNGYAGVILRIPVRDCSSGFRCYRVAALANVDFGNFCGTGYEFYEQILVLLNRQGASFSEVPITFTDRTAGISKASSRIQLQSAWSLLRWGIWGPAESGASSSARPGEPTTQGDATCFDGD